MAEPFETLREVGVALSGFRTDVSGQFSTLKWILGGIASLSVVAMMLLFNKIDRLEEVAVKNTVILERVEAQLSRMAADTTAIKATVQTASAEPSPESFEGWVGVKVPNEPSEVESIMNRAVYQDEGWIFLPKEKN